MLRLVRANKLSSRLALSLMAFGLVCVMIVSALFLLVDLPKAQQEIEVEINRVIDTFVEPATQAVFNLDEDTAAKVVAGFEQHAYIESAIIQSEDQVTLAEVAFPQETARQHRLLMQMIGSQEHKSFYLSLIHI